jgi:hypothetical protein
MERTKKVGFAMPIMSNRPDLGDDRKVGLQMPIDLQEDPPIKPGTPSEPPQESPPGSPRPEVPPPMREPGESPPPEELPGRAPEELPVRGPQGPSTPHLLPIPEITAPQTE